MYSYELEARKIKGEEAQKKQDVLNISDNHYPQEKRASKGSEQQCEGKKAARIPG